MEAACNQRQEARRIGQQHGDFLNPDHLQWHTHHCDDHPSSETESPVNMQNGQVKNTSSRERKNQIANEGRQIALK
jgi:hypothetical protein